MHSDSARAAGRSSSNSVPAEEILSRLTERERRCLRLVSEQLSSKEIGRLLGISKASVDTYCNRARAKLGVSDRRVAARMLLAAERTVDLAAQAPARRSAFLATWAPGGRVLKTLKSVVLIVFGG